MKKFYYLISIFAVLSLGACQNEEDWGAQGLNGSEVKIAASLENGTDSRTELNSGKISWEENDALSVFLGNATKQQATIIKETMEDTYAQFKISAGSDVILGGGTEDNENYFANVAYYPYGDNVTVAKDGDNYIVSAVFPAEQSFKDGSFGTNVYPMVAVSDGLNFGFRNVAGMIHIPLKGTATITKVTVESQNHKLAGNYQVTASADAVPTMEMASDATNKITLDCGTGVTLNENTALGFDFVLPVGTYEGGDLTFTFYDSNGTSMEFVAANDDKVERSKRTVFSEKLYRNDLGYEKVGENVYNVWSAKGLSHFSEVQQKGVTLNITDDIDFGNAEFKAIPVGRSASLTINGNGYTISNVKVVSGNEDNTTGQASMFYAYTGSTLSVSDLILENITVTADENSTGYAAAVVGYCEGAAILDNVDVVNATINGAKSSGALVGHLSGSVVATNCDFSGTVTLSNYEANGHYAGKYIGTLAGAATLTNCSTNVTVNGNLNAANVGDVYGRKVSGSLIIDDVNVVSTANDLYSLAAAATGEVKIALANDITLGNETEKCMAVNFANVTKLTIDGNDKTLTLKGKDASGSGSVGDEYVAGILATGADVTIKNLTIINDKLSCKGTETSAGRNTVYSFVRGVTVTYEDVIFDGGVQVEGNETFRGCSFTETVLTTNAEGYATDGRFCMFIDHEYDATGTYEVTLEGCTFNASGYGCVKVSGDKGANITVNVKDCSFTNTCPSNSWSKTTPKYDIKKTGANITVNDQGGNTWSTGVNAGIGEG